MLQPATRGSVGFFLDLTQLSRGVIEFELSLWR